MKKNFFNNKNKDKKASNIIDKILANKKQSSFVRESISATPEDAEIVRSIRAKITAVIEKNDNIPSKSEVYRMGLLLLKEKSNEELLKILRSLR